MNILEGILPVVLFTALRILYVTSEELPPADPVKVDVEVDPNGTGDKGITGVVAANVMGLTVGYGGYFGTENKDTITGSGFVLQTGAGGSNSAVAGNTGDASQNPSGLPQADGANGTIVLLNETIIGGKTGDLILTPNGAQAGGSAGSASSTLADNVPTNVAAGGQTSDANVNIPNDQDIAQPPVSGSDSSGGVSAGSGQTQAGASGILNEAGTSITAAVPNTNLG